MNRRMFRFGLATAIVVSCAPGLLWLVPERLHVSLVSSLPGNPAYYLWPLLFASNSFLVLLGFRIGGGKLLAEPIPWIRILTDFSLTLGLGVAAALFLHWHPVASDRAAAHGSGFLLVVVLVVLHRLFAERGAPSALRVVGASLASVLAVPTCISAATWGYLLCICFGCGWVLPY